MGELWIVDPSLNEPEIEGVDEILEFWNGRSRVFRPGLQPGDGPGPGAGYPDSAVVVLGSPASVHDDRPWISELSAWLQPILAGERSCALLGVCFGHQLIAHAAGGTVGYVAADRSKLLGIGSSRIEGSRLLPGSHALRVVVSHREEVKRIPPDYRTVARREPIEIDGMEHAERPIFSFQFHPEAREDFARQVGIDPGTIDDRVRTDSRRLLAAFAAFAAVRPT